MHYEHTKSGQTSFLEALPASPFPSRELDGEQLILATGGPTCSALYKSVGPVGLLLKTLVDSSIWRSTLYSLTWKGKATKQGRSYCRLLPSARPIAGIDALLWPTPRAVEGQRGVAQSDAERDSPLLTTRVRQEEQRSAWPTPSAKPSGTIKTVDEVRGNGLYRNGRKLQGSLEHAARVWPTPAARDYKPGQASRIGRTEGAEGLNDVVKAWPTVRASDGTHGGPNQRDSKGNAGLPGAVAWSTLAAQDAKNTTLPPSQATRDTLPGDLLKPGSSGQLNPAWVESLMGFPPGWTE